jgi:hypothetical protein
MNSWICEDLKMGWLTVAPPLHSKMFYYSCGVDDEHHCCSKDYPTLEDAKAAGIKHLKRYLLDVAADALESLDVLERQSE